MSIITDLVGIFSQNFLQVVSGARPMKADIKEQSKPMEHPVETGATVTDFRIILPVEINFELMLSPTGFKSEYDQIKQIYLRGDFLVLQTKVGIYKNMVLQGIPHTEDPSIFSSIPLALTAKETIIVQAQFGTLPPSSVKNKSDSSTVDTGEQQPKDAPEQSQSVLSGWFG